MGKRMYGIYTKFFARDKMFRHVYQHLEITAISGFIFHLLTGFVFDIRLIPLFILFSYLPDLDGTISSLIFSRVNPVAGKITGFLLKLDFKSAISYGTIHHKELDTLVLHNFISYSFFIFLLITAVKYQTTNAYYVLVPLLGHFTFDWLDDIYQLGHVKNWLSPFRLLFPESPLFNKHKILFPIPILSKIITFEPLDYISKLFKSQK